MGRCPPKPSGGRCIKEKCRISNRFAKGARIVEYGPVPAKDKITCGCLRGTQKHTARHCKSTILWSLRHPHPADTELRWEGLKTQKHTASHHKSTILRSLRCLHPADTGLRWEGPRTQRHAARHGKSTILWSMHCPHPEGGYS